jgi:hypothetical protein
MKSATLAKPPVSGEMLGRKEMFLNCLRSFNSAHGLVTRVIGITLLASLPSGLLSSFTVSAQTAPSPSTEPAPAQTTSQGTTQQTTPRSLQQWRSDILSRKALPKAGGCFTSAYPSLDWKEEPCTTPLPRPHPPATKLRPEIVGSGDDFTADATGTSIISHAAGSFDSVSGVTSETDSASGNADTFSLQLNTNRFKAITACKNSAIPDNCQGWQQFLFDTNGCPQEGACVLIQYWLLNYTDPSLPAVRCPTGWMPPSSNSPHCFQNSPNAAMVPPQTIADLGNMFLSGTVSGGNDTVAISVGIPPTLHSMSNTDSVLDLAPAWTQVEFNIFGDCCNHQANFHPDSGPTLVVRTSVEEGISVTCAEAGFTGETNNLSLVSTPALVDDPPGALPAIVFTESNAVPLTPRSCATNTCGHGSQACCDNNACGSGLTCSNGECTCGGPFQPCCRPGSTCHAGLTCLNTARVCLSERSACAGCTQTFNQCRNRCGSDKQCQCRCERSESSCLEDNSCGPFPPPPTCAAP